ncbi:hypothetical protein [Novosphingobium mangrovi (ex Huang et al. 2023)]|uniref:Lipoprotein n=1 Tax=Novosphingobium mangrovi (ex Huang et al. 2023) TaxID=2976432 RepID=A0ABT2I0P7_9SPHN|nr:hypothetical protein [Novosphingobium mangrovi (ex Huang et al. 2023)]MCT2398374.1 hypothetical protein [Novosphingobium mangrovi (ex Huang et al. 2023)]
MKWRIAVAALMLAGCGKQADSPPSAPPTSYLIRKADLYRTEPGDICRTRDSTFLQNLILRISAALPPGSTGFDFEDFDARAVADDGKGMEAVLRFRSSAPDGHAQMMYAAGPFDPATCTVGPMTGGIGTDPHAAAAMQTFSVDGPKATS